MDFFFPSQKKMEVVIWNKIVHSRPLYTRGWLTIKNLRLDCLSKQTSKLIGAYFGGLESIATDTLDLLNVSES